MSDKLTNAPSVKGDPDIIREGQNVTIMAPVAQVAADFGPAPIPTETKE